MNCLGICCNRPRDKIDSRCSTIWTAWHRSTAVFLDGLCEKHDLSDATFLVDQYRYLTPLSRLKLNGQIDYSDRKLIKKWFHTLKMRIDRFDNSWVGNRASVRDWVEQFSYDYNYQRPHQSFDDRTPAEEVID